MTRQRENERERSTQQAAEHYTANNADIETMLGRTESFLAGQGLERRETERIRLTLDMLLRRISEQLGWGTRCTLRLCRRMGRARIELRYGGKAFDPTLIGRESALDAWSAALLTDVGLVPLWSWRRGVNCLVLEPLSRTASVWPAQLIAAALALASALLLPGKWALALERCVFLPLLDGFFAILGAIAPILFFCALAALVCGAGEACAPGRPGRTLAGRFLTRTLLWTALGTAALAALCFPICAPAGGARTLALLASLLPRDPITPFLHGEAAQLTLLGLLCGAAVYALGVRAGRVRELAEQGAAVCGRVGEYVLALSPLLTFAAAGRLSMRGAAELAALWRPLAGFVLCALVMLTCKIAALCLRHGQNAAEVLKKLWPAFCAALSTASSAAAFGKAMDTCENELYVPHDLVLNGLSVGRRLCVPLTALCFPPAALYLAARAGETLGAAEAALLVLMSAALALALPPLRGALLLGAPLLLGNRGADGLAVAAVLNVVLDPLATACAGAYLHMELAARAKRKGS